MASSKAETKLECSDLPWGVSYKLLTMNRKYDHSIKYVGS